MVSHRLVNSGRVTARERHQRLTRIFKRVESFVCYLLLLSLDLLFSVLVKHLVLADKNSVFTTVKNLELAFRALLYLVLKGEVIRSVFVVAQINFFIFGGCPLQLDILEETPLFEFFMVSISVLI